MSGRVVRLLPWSSPSGQPAYLSTDDEGGYVSRLADEMETVQLSMGTRVVEHGRRLIADPDTSPGELRYVASRLVECLVDALRVAESRGALLAGERDDGE